MKTSLLITLLLLPILVAARAADPTVKSVLPFGVKAGHTSTVTIYGDNLAPTALKINKPGVDVKLIGVKPTDDKAKSKGNTVVTVDLNVPANMAGQTAEITLSQGAAKNLVASVAIVEDVKEEIAVKKPAGTFVTAMLISSPSVAITGTLDGDTADIFRLDAHVGDTWRISLLCGRAGSQLDPVLRVRDSRHITLMLSAGAKNKDRVLTFKAPEDGTYFIDITDAEARGGGGFEYRMSLTRD